jgi:hypothetical protein
MPADSIPDDGRSPRISGAAQDWRFPRYRQKLRRKLSALGMIDCGVVTTHPNQCLLGLCASIRMRSKRAYPGIADLSRRELEPTRHFLSRAVYSLMHLIRMARVSSNNGEPNMPVLKSLSFTAIPKSGNDPVQTRRAKFVTKLEEQKLLLKDPNHVRTVQRWVKVNGERQATTKQQAVPGGRRTPRDRSSCPSSSAPGPSSSRRARPASRSGPGTSCRR